MRLNVTFIHMLPLFLFLPSTCKINALSDVLCLQGSFTACLCSLKILKSLSGKHCKQLIKYFLPFLLPFCLHKCLSCLDVSLVNAEVTNERRCYQACLLMSVSTIYLCELLHVLHEITISLFFISQFLEKGPKS